MINKINIGVLWTVVIAIIPAISFINSHYANAADVERTNASIMIEVQQIGLDSKQIVNEMKLNIYADKMKEGIELKEYQQKEFDMLHNQRIILIGQQSELDLMRRGIK